MHQDGLIYKGDRIVNWDPLSQTAIADDEVEYKEVSATLYYIQYGPLIVATSRPETKLADTGVAVHPDDPRYKKYHNQTLNVDLAGHQIQVQVIADKQVNPEFGSGAIGLTPAHSLFDYELAQKHNLKIIPLINPDGRLNQNGKQYEGLTVLEARQQFTEALRQADLILKEEPYKQNLSISYRSGGTIEPLISKQWFVAVDKKVIDWQGKKLSLKEIATQVVETNEIEILPQEYRKVYFNWMNNLHDWCISRQLWYGHRIPVWYYQDQIKVQPDSPGENWTQDPDTLDTWFSSSLWTFSTLGWPQKTPDYLKFHPTDLLETGHDILFFWVARMILMTTYLTKEVPFKTVYLHGLIRDKNGKKMSKSLGNGIDPLDMIELYGADALRLSLVIGNAPGKDLKIYPEKIESFRNFTTKVWNSARYILSNINSSTEQIDPSQLSVSDQWILTKMQAIITEGTKLLENLQISEAGTHFYNFLWDDICNWYIETSKTHKNSAVLIYLLETILKLLHPFIPYTTEAIWQNLHPQAEMLIVSEWPKPNPSFTFQHTQQFEDLKQLIKTIRAEKTFFNLANDTSIQVVIETDQIDFYQAHQTLIERLAKVEIHSIINQPYQQTAITAHQIINPQLKCHLLLAGKINQQDEIQKLETTISTHQKTLTNLSQRLANQAYLDKAPQELIVETKAQQTEITQTIQDLTQKLDSLKGVS